MKSGTDINQDKELQSSASVCVNEEGKEKCEKLQLGKRREKNFPPFFKKLVKQTHWLQILKWMRRSRHRRNFFLFYCNDSTERREKKLSLNETKL
jgi:hypothetical protein